jgi:hypothetical protein
MLLFDRTVPDCLLRPDHQLPPLLGNNTKSIVTYAPTIIFSLAVPHLTGFNHTSLHTER